MKGMRNLTPAWGNAEPGDSEWEKDALIVDLEEEGQCPISIDRAVVVIEQCEPSDECPEGWSKDPLRITIYPDPDAGFNPSPHQLYVHAGRSGLMEVFLTRQQEIFRLLPSPAENVKGVQNLSPSAPVEALLSLAEGTLSGHYLVAEQETFPSGITETVAKSEGPDPELVLLAEEALTALRAYRDALVTKPNLFRGFNNSSP